MKFTQFQAMAIAAAISSIEKEIDNNEMPDLELRRILSAYYVDELGMSHEDAQDTASKQEWKDMKFSDNFMIWYYLNFIEHHFTERLMSQGIIPNETIIYTENLTEQYISFVVHPTLHEKEDGQIVVSECSKGGHTYITVYGHRKDYTKQVIADCQSEEVANNLCSILNACLKSCKGNVTIPKHMLIDVGQILEQDHSSEPTRHIKLVQSRKDDVYTVEIHRHLGEEPIILNNENYGSSTEEA